MTNEEIARDVAAMDEKSLPRSSSTETYENSVEYVGPVLGVKVVVVSPFALALREAAQRKLASA